MAEAPKSSSGGSGGGGGSADSYIGSFISLTSKSEIRYEGVLYNINTQESTIGLRNVRSFGTEGRKSDGPQVPPSNKIYEFILFRGSDIKDLQVKSSPPVQTATPIHSDPAIIQSHYPQAPRASMSLPSGTGSLTDLSSHASPHGLSRQTFQGSLPLHQPAGNLGPWGSSSHRPTTTGNGLAMPMYWQGYYGPSNGLQPQQQAFVQPPPGLSMPPSMQYPAMNASKFSASQLSENPPSLLPSFTAGNQNLQSSLLPAQSFPTVSDSSNLIPDTASIQALPTATLSSNLPMASPLTTTLVKSSTVSLVIDEPKIAQDPVMPFKSISEPLSSTVRMSSSVLNEGTAPSLVTPGHFLQPGPSMVPSLQSSQTVQKDVEVVRTSSPESLSSTAVVTEMEEPILPLPSPPEPKIHGGSGYTHHGSRGGHGRGRGNQFFHSSTRFTEEFDFTAMNEKFNKDEVWGHLGKNNMAQGDGDDSQDEDNARLSKSDVKPVYVKDDFFDSLSCDALDGGSRNGRTRFSEKFRRDTEAFGNFSRHRGGGGGWGPSQGGRSQGGYHGRGYGYVGRGRGYNMSNRVV